MRTLIGEFVGLPIRPALVGMLLCASTACAGVELKPLSGEPITGELISLNDKEVVLRVDDKAVSTPIKQTLQIDIGSPPKDPGKDAKYTDVVLVDGTLLHCSEFSIKGSEVNVKLLAGQEIKFPLDSLKSLLKEAHDPEFRADWDRFVSKKAHRDQLIVKAMPGPVLNTVPVTFGEADAEGKAICIKPGPGAKQVAIERIHGMIFVRGANAAAPPLLCKVLDTDANIYYASALTLNRKKASLTTTTGLKVELPRAALARLDYIGGKLVYLSDWAAADMRVTTDTDGLVRRDCNLDDGPIQLNKVQYEKGLSVHAFAQLDYPLGGEFREFKAVIGVDDLITGIHRPTIIKIEADGKELMKETFTRKDKPKDVKLNVLNVKTLTISVTSDDVLMLGRHVDLANARVSK
jgi:hypothetical protein